MCLQRGDNGSSRPASDWLQTQLTLSQWELGLLSPNQFSLASTPFSLAITPNLPYSQLVLAKLWQCPLAAARRLINDGHVS